MISIREYLRYLWERGEKCPSCGKYNTFKDVLNDDFYECESCGYIEDRITGHIGRRVK